MTDKTIVHLGENSPEKVAFDLMKLVADIEKKTFHHVSAGNHGLTVADREWIYKTYAECFNVVRGYRP